MENSQLGLVTFYLNEAVISAGAELLDKDTALVQTTYTIILLSRDFAICMVCGRFQGEQATNKSPTFFIVSCIFGHLETIIQIDIKPHHTRNGQIVDIAIASSKPSLLGVIYCSDSKNGRHSARRRLPR